MNYILCHKDIPVLRFSTEDEEITEVSEIISREHLPIGISPENEKGKTLKSQFRSWWKSRSIPASRQNLDTALEQLGNVTTDYLIEKSYGLSLSDHYWAKPLKSSLSWKDVNFFQNSFSDDVGKALFGILNSDSTAGCNISHKNFNSCSSPSPCRRLNRFDGIEFTHYEKPSKNENEANLNIITLCLHSDNHHIWVASTEKLYLFDMLNETFSAFELPADDGKMVNSVFGMTYDNNGQLWIGTVNGLFVYNEQKSTLKHYLHSSTQ